MHKRDSWAAVNGQVNRGRRPRTWTSFKDCLELHKLTFFSADAAKRERFYIQQVVCKPQRGHCATAYLANGSVEWLRQTPPYIEGQLQSCINNKEREYPFQQGWSSRHSAAVCPNIVAEPVQPQPLNSSQVNLYVATRPWGHRASHGWEAGSEDQDKRNERYSPIWSQG